MRVMQFQKWPCLHTERESVVLSKIEITSLPVPLYLGWDDVIFNLSIADVASFE